MTAALCLGLSLTPVLAEDASTEVTATDSIGLQKIDDGFVVSNIHTSKWRVFTDSGRDLFLQARFSYAVISNIMGHCVVFVTCPFCYFKG